MVTRFVTELIKKYDTRTDKLKSVMSISLNRLNSAAVYRLIDQHGPISRIQISANKASLLRQRDKNYTPAY